MNSILDRIAEQKHEEVSIARHKNPLASLPQPQLPRRDFIAALYDSTTPAIIAEIKKASPSKGIIRQNFNVEEIAKAYSQAGARCLSVLTDEVFFQGSAKYLSLAKTNSHLPVLRKDFIIDEYQIHQSYSLEADCILLIVALLDDSQLHDYSQIAQSLNMAILVESHTAPELERALKLPTPLIGVNNRSLHSFKTDIHLSLELKKYIPNDRLMITERGINDATDINIMRKADIHRFLIGETLMRAQNIEQELAALILN